MKVAILGGGFTGMTAAYYARAAGHDVTMYERGDVLGGLAAGFKEPSWKWYLERAYHHLFKNDSDIIEFAKEVRFPDIYFVKPETASLFEAPGVPKDDPKALSIFPFDSPKNLLTFPYLTLPQRVRTGAALAFLKASPFLRRFESETCEEFLTKTMGEEVWRVLWRELFRKKFGKYAGNILASFIWARIKKRTPELGYIRGGFQRFIDHTEGVLIERGVDVAKSTIVSSLSFSRNVYRIEYERKGEGAGSERFDAVICTLPSPIIPKVAEGLLPQPYLMRFEKLKFLHAINLILETKEPLLEKTYWLNILAKSVPFMVLVAHTNFVNKARYGGRHLSYIGRYVEATDPILKMTKEEVFDHYKPHLEKIAGFRIKPTNAFLFKGPFAQPIFDKDFLKNKPDFETPQKRFLIANLDMTYPYDRGTNYAVKLGREVVRFL